MSVSADTPRRLGEYWDPENVQHQRLPRHRGEGRETEKSHSEVT
jgi:hypothetical protein